MQRPVKQVIVIRKDLKMRRGKEIAQGAHASLKIFSDMFLKPSFNSDDPPEMRHFFVNEAMEEWLGGSFTKICVYVESEQELLNIYEKAKESGLPCSLIRDNGLTEFGGVPTYTCVGIGPDYCEYIDPITGGLPLY